MIHIKYKIKKSNTHGIGLFADQNIKAGDLIYTPSPLLDVDITQEQFDLLSPNEKEQIMYYGYKDKKSQKWHVAFDAIRVLNHAPYGIANVTQDEDMIMIALRDIKLGEEIVQDYQEIFSADDEHFIRINKLKNI
jgi:SET domain-containing protein